MAGTKLVVERLGAQECWALLRSTDVGRVGVTIDALPAVLPVLFAVDDEAIVFRATPHGRMAGATDEAVVAFEVDQLDRDTGEGWSVAAQGMSRPVVDPRDCRRLLALLPDEWRTGGLVTSDGRGPPLVVRMTVATIQGWQAGDALRRDRRIPRVRARSS